MDLTPDPNLPVKRVGQYDLLRKLGQGGMAEVFLARRTGIEGFAHLCVVKTILPQFANDPDFVEMFFDEARITVELQHTNIVRVFDLDRDGEFVYLAMEFIDGMDVLSLMIEFEERGASIPFAAMLHIVSQTLRGLLHAHMATDYRGRPLGLVHRDISPGNILLGINGAVKLSDFGVARASISRRAEEPGMLVGKLRYFAPELLMGADASQQSDIFAVGACLYEMLAMRPLFPPAETLFQQQLYVRDWSPEALLEQHLNFPDGIDEILLRALAKDPAARYHSAQHFLEDCIDLERNADIRLGDVRLVEILRQLRQAGIEAAAPQQAQTTRFRDESRGQGGDAPPAPELLSGIPSEGQGVPPGGDAWPEEPARDEDATAALRRALTQFREDSGELQAPRLPDEPPQQQQPRAAPTGRGSFDPAVTPRPRTVSDPNVRPTGPLAGGSPLGGGGDTTPMPREVPPPPPGPPDATPFPDTDRMFQKTGIVTPTRTHRRATPPPMDSSDPEASIDEPSIMEPEVRLVPEQSEQVPRIADVLTNPPAARKRLPQGPGTTLQFRMAASTMVELFTHRGRLGPYPAEMVVHAAEHGRMSGIELVSVDSAPWEPLFNFLTEADPEQRRRIKAFDFVRLGPLLLHWARKAGRFETMLWSGSSATYLGIAEGRVCAVATYPPMRRSDHPAAEGIARAMSWPRGGALGISAPHLSSSHGDPLLTRALLDAVGDSLPAHQLRRMAVSGKHLRMQVLPEATTAVDRVQGFGDRARTLVRQRRFEFQSLSEQDLRAAVKLVALGLAKAVGRK